MKIIEYDNLDNFLQNIKSRGKLVVVGGVFDLLHEGHVSFLQESKKHGDILLVILESDDAVKRRKGENRPVNNQDDRAKSLAGLDEVDFILKIPDFKTDQDYYNLVKKLEPDIIAVTNGDPAYNKKSEQAKMVGGKIVKVIERVPNLSTTELLNNS